MTCSAARAADSAEALVPELSAAEETYAHRAAVTQGEPEQESKGKSLAIRFRRSAASVSGDTGVLVNALGLRGHIPEPFSRRGQGTLRPSTTRVR